MKNADTDAKDSMRLFYALWPDGETRAALMALQAPIRGRLVPYDNLHMTLAFLGEQPASVLPALKDILTHLAPAELMLTLDRIGYFPRLRVAWAGMHAAPDELLSLQKQLVKAIIENGNAYRNEHRFRPHVTLARNAELPPDMVFTPITWKADRVVLVQSHTNAEGAIYKVIASRSLASACRTRDERMGERGELGESGEPA